MTGTVIKPTARRAAGAAAATVVLLGASVLLAGPASADVPIGWGPDTEVDRLYVLGVLVGIPVALFALIVAAVYLPSLARGERVAPGATRPEDQWLGGRRDAGALTASSASASSPVSGQADEASQVDGGASARW